MKILKMEIKGFRSLKNISFAPGDLNVIIGPNGTGKSNLLRMLELVSISAQGRLGKYIQHSGGMAPLVWDGISEGVRFDMKSSNFCLCGRRTETGSRMGLNWQDWVGAGLTLSERNSFCTSIALNRKKKLNPLRFWIGKR